MCRILHTLSYNVCGFLASMSPCYPRLKMNHIAAQNEPVDFEKAKPYFSPSVKL